MAVNIIDTMSEEIYQAFRGILPPRAVKLLIRQHDEIRTLENSVKEMERMMVNMVEAMKLNQDLYTRQKAALKKANMSSRSSPTSRRVTIYSIIF